MINEEMKKEMARRIKQRIVNDTPIVCQVNVCINDEWSECVFAVYPEGWYGMWHFKQIDTTDEDARRQAVIQMVNLVLDDLCEVDIRAAEFNPNDPVPFLMLQDT